MQETLAPTPAQLNEDLTAWMIDSDQAREESKEIESILSSVEVNEGKWSQ